jgi:tetratricopeptide (TPR) repeat protein
MDTGPQTGLKLDRLSVRSSLRRTPTVPDLPDEAETYLKAYIPGAIINRLSAGHSGWIAELRKVTVLFIKLPDMDEDTPLETAQSIARLLQRSVYRFEGSLNKISVDDKGITVVAAFGLPPLSHEDDPARGVQTALMIRDELNALDVRSAIGVTTGRIFCGAIGNHQRREYTIIGNTVNLSARLMSLAGAQAGLVEAFQIPILCDRPTYDSARSVIGFESLAPLQVKGRSDPVEVFHPVSQHKSFLRAKAELIGRQEEKSLLAAALQELQRGRARQSIAIRGEAGIGKSRLTEEAARQAETLQLNVLKGAGDAIDKSTPYHAWRPVFAKVFGIERLLEQAPLLDEHRQGIRESVLRKLEQVDPDLLRHAPLVSVVLPIDIPENEFTSAMTGETRGGNIREVLVRLLNHEAARSPLVVVMEDLHWFDSSSWTLLLDAQHKVRPVLMVLNTRPLPEPVVPEYLQLTERADTRVIDLEALPLDDVEAIVCQRLGVLSAPPEIGRLIREKTEGHPFFAEELAYALRDTGIIQIEGQTCRLSSRFTNIDEISLPDSLQAAITSRIDSLNPSQQLTLKVASVIGRIFAFRLLKEIYPVESDRPALSGHMDALTTLNLTVVESDEPDLEYIFKHAVTQEVAYNLMLFSQRRQLHQTVATWIEENFKQDISQNYTLLAYHWRQAAGTQEVSSDKGTVAKALQYLDKAGDQSLNTFANREAIHFFRDTLALSSQVQVDPFRRAQWHRKLGQAHLGLGKLEEAKTNFLKALELLGQRVPGSAAGMLGGLLVQLARQTGHRLWPGIFRGRIVDPSQEAVRLEIVQIHLQLATALFLIADADPLPLFYSVIANLNIAESVRETPGLGYVYAQMGAICGFIPAPAQYRHYSAQADRLMKKFDHNVYYVGAQISLAAYESGIGMWEDLKPRLEKVIVLCDELGDNRQAGEALAYLGANAEIAGNASMLNEYNRRLWESAQRRENPVQILWSKQLACSIAASLGRPDESMRIANEALSMMEKTWVGEATDIIVRSALCHAEWQQGRHAAAWSSAKQLLDKLAKSSIVDYSIYLAYSHLLQVVLYALEQTREAGPSKIEPDEVERYAGLLIRIHKKYCAIFKIGEPAYALARGHLAWHQHRPESAYKHWRAAAEKAADLGMVLEAGKAQLALGLHLPQDHPDRGGHLARARAVFTNGGFENWAARAG